MGHLCTSGKTARSSRRSHKRPSTWLLASPYRFRCGESGARAHLASTKCSRVCRIIRHASVATRISRASFRQHRGRTAERHRCGAADQPRAAIARTGRVRHVYVLPNWRGHGVGRMIVRGIEQRAVGQFDALVIRTDSAKAARFYQALGYAELPIGGTATHRRALAMGA
jgi:GNAT superfamily N-acetyltransferase